MATYTNKIAVVTSHHILYLDPGRTMNGTCFAATWMLSPWARLRSDLCRLRIDVCAASAGRASARGESASSLSSCDWRAAASTAEALPCFI